MFELHITCTKDIEKLSIDFSDGTSVVQEKTEKPEKQEKSKKVSKEKEDFKEEDLSKYQNSKKSVSQEIIEKPKIPDRTETKVDDILQELEF